ncbi:MAG TPA: nitroreductase family protein [Dehalococcoidales bacterium]|nr:nitroreductase family protein [Dehalococcoidales bacterium]
MSIYETILKRRTIRRFQNKAVPYELLEKCVDAARLAPSAKNQQSLEYIIVDDEPLLARVFDTLRFAGSIKPAGYPPPEQRPKAYIVILAKKEITLKEWVKYDVGLAAENMILVALEEGVGSCCVGLINIKKLSQVLNIPDDYTIELVLALGYPDEQPVVAEFSGATRIWEDKDAVIHVPKRRLTEILHRNKS